MKRFYSLSCLLIASLFVTNLQAQSSISGFYAGVNVGASWLLAEGNNVLQDANKNHFSFTENAGYMLRAELGYDFNSVYGIRGFLGTTHNRWSDVRLVNNGQLKFSSYYFTADFLLNLSNLFSGYSPDRRMDFLAFAGAGYVNREKLTDLGESWSGILGRAGLQSNYKLNSRLDLKLLLELNATGDEYNAFVADFPMDMMPALSVGLAYKL